MPNATLVDTSQVPLTATNPLATQPSVGSVAVSATNPMPTQLSVANAAATSANPIPTQLSQGNAALSSSNPLPIIPNTGYSASATLTRTNDTNVYTANDVVGAATGSTAALTFSTIGPSGGRIIINSVTFEVDAAALIASETSYTLHLYNITPPSALGDNAAWDLPSGDRTSYLGSLALGTPVDLGSTLWIATDNINKQIKLASANLFAYLVTAGAYTPTASRVFVITLHAVSV